jgi:hypothetical protein
MDRYPRTVGEFIQHSRMVIIECEACRRKAPIDLSVLELTFGADFDMYLSMRSLRDQLGCPACGHPRPVRSVECARAAVLWIFRLIMSTSDFSLG